MPSYYLSHRSLANTVPVHFFLKLQKRAVMRPHAGTFHDGLAFDTAQHRRSHTPSITITLPPRPHDPPSTHYYRYCPDIRTRELVPRMLRTLGVVVFSVISVNFRVAGTRQAPDLCHRPSQNDCPLPELRKLVKKNVLRFCSSPLQNFRVTHKTGTHS